MAKFPVCLGEYRFSASVSARRKGGEEGGNVAVARGLLRHSPGCLCHPLKTPAVRRGRRRAHPPGHLADAGRTVPELPEWDHDRDPRDPGIGPSSPAYFLMCHPPVASGMQSISGE